MALITKPNMQQVWASGGDIVEPSDLKKQQGWTVEVPPHQFENWIQNRQDEYLAHINQRGIPAWDGLTNYEAGGLSYVQGSDGKVYKSVAASGPSSVVSNPTTDGTDTYWTIAFADVGAFLTQTAGDARYAQRSNNLSDLTNVATARTNLGAAPVVSPAFTGTPTAVTASPGTSTTQLATTAFVTTANNLKANINSPTFTGVPSAPTAVPGTNTTQVATTAFVQASTPLNLKTSGIAGIFSNLKASAPGTSATVTVTADAICLKNASNEQIVLSPVTVTPGIAVSGANGLDSGVIAASTWYSVWVIWNGTTAAGILSLSATAPTMPSGYTHKARVGWIRTDSTANKFPLGFTQAGNSVQYKVATGSNLIGLPVLASGNQGSGSVSAPTYASISTSNHAPPTAGIISIVSGAVSQNSTGFNVAPNNSYSGNTSTTNPGPINVDSSTGIFTTVHMKSEFILESSNIYAFSNNSSFVLQMAGWEDNI